MVSQAREERERRGFSGSGKEFLREASNSRGSKGIHPHSEDGSLGCPPITRPKSDDLLKDLLSSLPLLFLNRSLELSRILCVLLWAGLLYVGLCLSPCCLSRAIQHSSQPK